MRTIALLFRKDILTVMKAQRFQDACVSYDSLVSCVPAKWAWG